MKLNTITLSNVNVDVHVTTNGRFIIVPAGAEDLSYPAPLGRGESLDEATVRAKVSLARRRAEVAVPFIVVEDGPKYRRGVARSIHARTRRVLVTYDDGVKGELERTATVFAADTDEGAVTEFIRQDTISREARHKASRIQRDHELRLDAVVKDKITEAAAAAVA